jgi:uncharacterized protein YvpB
VLTYKNFIVVSVVITSLSTLLAFPETAPAQTKLVRNNSTENLINLTAPKKLPSVDKPVVTLSKTATQNKNTNRKLTRSKSTKAITVPFYSQFKDITSPVWQKVGCGIASVAMIIGYYEKDTIPVDKLLKDGVASGAFDDNAGWSHQGLINLAKKYKLDGQSYSLSEYTSDVAFAKLEEILKRGPVMASVHYTFEPTNPIPHLVVVNSVKDGQVFYNDPAEKSGNGSISIDKFKKAWKKRYIEIRPTV